MALERMVCVTGASGQLGSWLVKRLLERGYRVRAAFRDPADAKKTGLVTSLPGADKRLQVVRGQLLEEGGLDDAVAGCDGVFHCASPIEFSPENPCRDCIELMLNATVNLLTACSKASSIRRIIFTSSASTVKYTLLKPTPGQRFDERCWADVEMCEREKPPLWAYAVCKTLSEKKAFDLAQEFKLDLITVLPTIVSGPFLSDNFPPGVKTAVSLITGDTPNQKFIRRNAYVHIDDMTDAYIFLYETPPAQGRYIVSNVNASITEVAELVKTLFPTIKLPDNLEDVGEIVPYYWDNSKLKELGFKFKHGLADIFESTIKCCVEKGLLRYAWQAP